MLSVPEPSHGRKDDGVASAGHGGAAWMGTVPRSSQSRSERTSWTSNNMLDDCSITQRSSVSTTSRHSGQGASTSYGWDVQIDGLHAQGRGSGCGEVATYAHDRMLKQESEKFLSQFGSRFDDPPSTPDKEDVQASSWRRSNHDQGPTSLSPSCWYWNGPPPKKSTPNFTNTEILERQPLQVVSNTDLEQSQTKVLSFSPLHKLPQEAQHHTLHQCISNNPLHDLRARLETIRGRNSQLIRSTICDMLEKLTLDQDSGARSCRQKGIVETCPDQAEGDHTGAKTATSMNQINTSIAKQSNLQVNGIAASQEKGIVVQADKLQRHEQGESSKVMQCTSCSKEPQHIEGKVQNMSSFPLPRSSLPEKDSIVNTCYDETDWRNPEHTGMPATKPVEVCLHTVDHNAASHLQPRTFTEMLDCVKHNEQEILFMRRILQSVEHCMTDVQSKLLIFEHQAAALQDRLQKVEKQHLNQEILPQRLDCDAMVIDSDAASKRFDTDTGDTMETSIHIMLVVAVDDGIVKHIDNVASSVPVPSNHQVGAKIDEVTKTVSQPEILTLPSEAEAENTRTRHSGSMEEANLAELERKVKHLTLLLQERDMQAAQLQQLLKSQIKREINCNASGETYATST